MYTLEIDLTLYFTPPMEHRLGGIVVSRSFQLPFAPYDGLSLVGRPFFDTPNDQGMTLSDVAWDVDRNVFIASSTINSIDFPIAYLADEVRSWIDRGWKFGRFEPMYDEERFPEDDGTPVEHFVVMTQEEEAHAEALPAIDPKKRLAEFNKLMKALVREMAAGMNNMSTAFAIDRTGCFFGKPSARQKRSPMFARANGFKGLTCHGF